MSNAPSSGLGYNSSPYSPDYIDLSSKDNLQQITDSKLIQGSPWNPGVILAKDSLQVPLEVQFGITDDKTNPSKPSLMPLFKTRYVEGGQVPEDKTQAYYQQLKGGLPQNLQDLINENSSKELEERDPDVSAFDMSLRFEAKSLAVAGGLAVPGSQNPLSQVETEKFSNMADIHLTNTLSYSTTLSHYLDNYLSTTTSSDPDHDIFLNASNQIKDALVLLNMNPTPPAA